MNNKSIEVIELTSEEAAHYAKIPAKAFLADKSTWTPIGDAMLSLINLLDARDAIPEIRVRLFNELAEVGQLSELERCESNGTKGDAIYKHGHFVEYLHYFIKGPNLPKAVVDGFVEIVNEDRGTSGMLLKELQKYVRKCVRDYNIEKTIAATNFWRLSYEVDYDYPDVIRRAAMTAR